ncbi:metal-dependent hydrolase [Novosphingobium profundi]|uniref:metal-dependent hydrolase n=1 Tax=Novosphingobium profundi TaxID=1774954 RepID=UPI001BDA8BBA|nr:metal-dependent hydrolase [Novosphingobium profundi]MBT0668430.1 metal-dependent hydrolase [Novosphingobium profundi]
MDNLTHSLVGWALAETGLKRRTRKGLAACVLAANMPDIDVFFGWSPWAPLAMHRGFTHGLVGGVLVMPPILAALLWLLDRWQVRRGARFGSGPGMHTGWLVALCYLGALTHPLLDLQNTYAVQLFSLASSRWFHTDGLFIISPWLLAMLGTGIALSRRRAAKQSGRAAVASLMVVLVFIGGNIAISQMARTALAKSPPHADPDRVFAGPEPIAFWRREMVWREAGRVAHGNYDPLRRPFALLDYTPASPDHMSDSLVQKAERISPELRDFLDWSQVPFARIKRGRCSARVEVGDARFAGERFARSFRVDVEVPLELRGCQAR